MSSTDPQAGEPIPHDKDYVDIIRSDTEIEKKFIDKEGIPAKIIYFCHDCQSLTKPKRIGKKLQFSCTECKGSNVSFGTDNSVNNYYKELGKKKH